MKNAVHTHDLIKEYAPGRGVSGISVSVPPGGTFCVLGRNGSGKSTFVRLLAGIEQPTSGKLRVLDLDPCEEKRRYRSRLGVVLDTSIHWERLSGFENAYFIANCYGLAKDRIASRLQELFAWADMAPYMHDPVRTYSFGMRRKLSVLEAVMHEPPLLILDEPTTGLDAHFLVKLAELIRKRSEMELTTWIAGNDPDWVENIATKVAFMDVGCFVTVGTVPEMIAEVSPFQEVRIGIANAAPIPRVEMAGIRSFAQSGETVTVLLEPDPMLVPMVLEAVIGRGGILASVEISRSSLRDAFLLKTGKTLDQ